MGTAPHIFPNSFAQQRLRYLDQFDPGKSVYNMPYAVQLHTQLDLDCLQRSLNEIVRRHESLRTTFASQDGRPVQVIAPQFEIALPVIDLRELKDNHKDAELKRRAQLEAEQSFDLLNGPLMRVQLLRLDEAKSVLLVTMHHIISDGWSVGIFLRELAILYEAYSAGRSSPLVEPSLQYVDYAVWQRNWLQGPVLEEQLSYWRRLLNGAPLVLNLCSDKPRPALQTFQGARRYTELPATLAADLRAFSCGQNVTLFMTLLAAFELLLWRYSRQDDVMVGTPIAGRNRSELESLIGFLANTLPIRIRLSGRLSFLEFLQQVREGALEVYAHPDLPFDRLVEELRPERSLSHLPLFQVIFALENSPQEMEFPRLSARWLEIDRGTARNDLSLFMIDKGGDLTCMWEYSTDLFNDETIERMMLSYRQILDKILKNPDELIAYISPLTQAESVRLLDEWNSETSEQTADACIQQLFAHEVEQHPDAIALVFGNERLTYRELNSRANQLAHYLRKRGVGPETPVGVCLDRSAEMIVALLGILKAGGAYVPLDPDYPSERLAFTLADSRVALLLTVKRFGPIFHASDDVIIWLDECPELAGESTENPLIKGTSDNLAYVIYTSGSTGVPKGVGVSHRTAVHLFTATKEKLGFLEGDTWTVVHSSAFDFSVWEIWGSLLQGGCLIVVPLEIVQSPADLYSLLCREQVTVLNQTPSALRQLLDIRRQRAGQDWNLRLIVCGGDVLDQELAADLVQLGIPVWNFYGPTESTVWTTCTLIEGPPADNLISIGRPIADLKVYLLDDYLQPVPMGVPGELFIGGVGLARGYLNRPELTAERFVPDLFSTERGQRLYRTGDLARYQSDGKIEFLGRLDTQVKLRGFRIELGEIETVLSRHPGVTQAVVVIRKDQSGDQRLVAYFTADDPSLGSNDLRSFLQLYLPDYMVPSAFMRLEAMPLTPNKKVDRRVLPDPDYLGSENIKQFVAPQDPIAELLSDIWATVLGVERIGIYDNFFDRGGHSLLATQVVSRIRDTFHVDVSVRALFESPCVASLTQKIRAAIQEEQNVSALPLEPVRRDLKLPLSFAQQRLWFLDQLEPLSPFYNISRAVRLRGALNLAALGQALDEIVKRHESVRTVFGEDGDPFQRITAARPLPLPVIDLAQIPAALREEEANRLAAEEIRQPFDLSNDLVLRASLISIDADDHLLVLTLHHIAADGWSLGVLFRELTALYGAFSNQKPSPLPTLPVQYVDFAVWQREWLQGEVLSKLLSYWQKQLSDAPPELKLQTDKPRPVVQTFRGAYERQTISLNLLNSLKQLSRSQGASLFMTCLAVFQLLLSRYTGQEDLIVGTDVANRTKVETEGLIGFFTNLLPLRAKISGNLTFTEWLRRVRELTLEAYAHSDLPFDKLVEE